MPGVPGRSGRRGKLTAQHIAEGTYRADRHGERVELAIGSSKPRPMLLLGKDEQELWDMVTGGLPEHVLHEIESPTLTMLVALWSQWKRLWELWQADPLDRELRKSTLEIGAQAQRMFSQFGMSPADRSRIKAAQEKKKSPADAIKEMLEAKLGK